VHYAGINFVRTFKPFLFGAAPRSEYFSQDGLHLTNRGYKALFNTLNTLAAQLSGSNSCRFLYFRGPRAPLSNLFPCTINCHDHCFICVEQGYQFRKAVHHSKPLLRIAVLNSDDPFEMMRIGSNIDQRDSWRACKAEVLLELLGLKV
jgi:hypothetical protein